jgi:hypothetical protein
VFKSATNDAATDSRLRDSNGSTRSNVLLALRGVFLSLRERFDRRRLVFDERFCRTVLLGFCARLRPPDLSRSERNTPRSESST